MTVKVAGTGSNTGLSLAGWYFGVYDNKDIMTNVDINDELSYNIHRLGEWHTTELVSDIRQTCIVCHSGGWKFEWPAIQSLMVLLISVKLPYRDYFDPERSLIKSQFSHSILWTDCSNKCILSRLDEAERHRVRVGSRGVDKGVQYRG